MLPGIYSDTQVTGIVLKYWIIYLYSTPTAGTFRDYTCYTALKYLSQDSKVLEIIGKMVYLTCIIAHCQF